MRRSYCATHKKICVVIRANTRLQLVMATAALLEFCSAKERKIGLIIVASGAPNGISADLAGFPEVLGQVAPVHFIEKNRLKQTLNILARKKQILSVSSSLFPHDIIFFGLKNRIIPQLIATEEGIGTYLGLKGRLKKLRQSPSLRHCRDIITCIMSAAAAPVFKSEHRRLLFKSGCYDPKFLFWIKNVINRLIESLGEECRAQIARKQFDLIVAVPPDKGMLLSYTRRCIGKSVLVKNHPHFGANGLDLAPMKNVAREVVVYAGFLSVEELCVLTGVRQLLATNSSSLIYASLVADVDAMNLTDVTPKGWRGKDVLNIYSKQITVELNSRV